MVKNRIIIEVDTKHNICAQVTSSTYEKKTRTTIIHKNEKFYKKQNTKTEEEPKEDAKKAMGIECD